MKPQGIIAHLSLALVAIGTAAAQSLFATPVYVHGYPWPSGSIAVCTQVPQNICTPTGAFNCRVLVQIFTPAGPNLVSTIGYRDVICTVPWRQPTFNEGWNGTPLFQLRQVDPYIP